MAEDLPYRVRGHGRARASCNSALPRWRPTKVPGEVVTVAGRIMLRREMGKLTFMTLTDWTGSVQLFAGAQWTGRFGELNKLSLGDWVAATGEVVRTRTGELSVRVAGLGAAGRSAPAFSRQMARHNGHRHAVPPALRRHVGQRAHPGGPAGPEPCQFRLYAVSWRTGALSKWKPPFSTLSRAARRQSHLSPTTMRSIWTFTCASRSNCT